MNPCKTMAKRSAVLDGLFVVLMASMALLAPACSTISRWLNDKDGEEEQPEVKFEALLVKAQELVVIDGKEEAAATLLWEAFGLLQQASAKRTDWVGARNVAAEEFVNRMHAKVALGLFWDAERILNAVSKLDGEKVLKEEQQEIHYSSGVQYMKEGFFQEACVSLGASRGYKDSDERREACWKKARLVVQVMPVQCSEEQAVVAGRLKRGLLEALGNKVNDPNAPVTLVDAESPSRPALPTEAGNPTRDPEARSLEVRLAVDDYSYKDDVATSEGSGWAWTGSFEDSEPAGIAASTFNGFKGNKVAGLRLRVLFVVDGRTETRNLNAAEEEPVDRVELPTGVPAKCFFTVDPTDHLRKLPKLAKTIIEGLDGATLIGRLGDYLPPELGVIRAVGTSPRSEEKLADACIQRATQQILQQIKSLGLRELGPYGL